MRFRIALGALAACTLVHCARGTLDDPSGDDATDGGAAAPDSGAADAGSPDSGPPATVGGEDAGGVDGAAPPSGCATLNECPYESATQVSAVGCEDGGCSITCSGDNYDVNGVLSDGCEVPASCPVCNSTSICPVGHTEASAVYVGSFPCDDSSSMQDLTGNVPSDARAHSPAVPGFVVATGSAPGFFNIYGSGGTFCEDDANFTLTMSAPTSQLACYVLTLVTDKQTQTCTTSASGTCAITNGSGSYSDGSTLYVEVSKSPSCAAGTTNDDGTFAITGHL
jgi:hypothetical protein